jgi:hypothetical protein
MTVFDDTRKRNQAMLFLRNILVALAILLGMMLVIVGCSGRPEIFPNSDNMLRKTSTQFAADAAKRFPYKLDAARAGEADARAQVGYALDVLEIANLSDQDWTDVELWVNQEYCVYLPKMESHKLKHLTFQMIFDEEGQSFPTNNNTTRIEKLEMFRDGKMYDVKLQLAD